MLNNEAVQQIHNLWDKYLADGKLVYDLKGNSLDNLDEQRLEAIEQLKIFIQSFLSKKMDLYEFKATIDAFNRRNNWWGFTAIKGQMFFNQLVKYHEAHIDKLTHLLQFCICQPKQLTDAADKINQLETFCQQAYNKAIDKRKAANPSSVGYFLSYFWQIQNHAAWPILYTSQIRFFQKLGVWQEQSSQKEGYQFFYQLNEVIKGNLADYTRSAINNWDIEHAFWNSEGNPNQITTKNKQTKRTVHSTTTKPISKRTEKKVSFPVTINVELNDYLIPKVVKLIELGSQVNISPATKGKEFEDLVAEIFKQLDFEVEILGQGTGRNPDAILRFREENTAFIVDAKAYSDGYSLGTDDRAIKEYINHYCPKLNKEGYKKIGFIIVSNTFKSNFDGFINSITWNTEIKRFILLTSEALLYLLAFKTRDRLSLSMIIDCFISLGNLIEAKDVITEFNDI